MSLLSQVVSDAVKRPYSIVIYGPDGVGKTTFGADAPSPIFLGSEKGYPRGRKIHRLPKPKSFNEVLQATHELITDKHDFQTLVVDSLDWLEPVVWNQVMASDPKQPATIEEAFGGYGKGYVAANKLWISWIHQLDELREKRGMNTILIAHSQVKTFNDPQHNSAYDRYQLKLNDKASALFREAVDCVLFANYEVFTKKEGNKAKAYGDGKRVLYTERRPAFDAKNRLGLPFEVDLSWAEFVNAAEKGEPDSVEHMMSNITQMMTEITDPELKKVVEATVEKAGQDPIAISKIQNRLRTRLSA